MPKVDYEARVLRSVVLYPEDVLHKVIYSLRPEDFTQQQWKKMFTELKQAVTDGKHSSMDLIDHLSNRGSDVEALISAWNSTYDGTSIEEPIKTIKNRSNLDEIRRIYENGISEVKKVDTVADAHISKIISHLSKLNIGVEQRTTADVISSMQSKMDRYVGRTIYGVPFGVPKIDEITKGMQAGHLWVMGAYTSMGKSWFALRAAREFLRANKRVAYFSFEMGAEEILWRLAIQDLDNKLINLNNSKSRIGIEKRQIDEVQSEFEVLKAYPLTVVDSISNFDELRLSMLHQIYSMKAECVVVDYLQNVIMPKSQGEYDSLNRLVLELQNIARKNGVFVLALSQVNRESMKVQNTNVFGFKGSGNLENAADVAITINPVEEDKNQRQFVIGKNREGITGEVTLDTDLSRGAIWQSLLQMVK